MDFLKAEQGKITYKGKSIRLRGFGVGTWLCLEHFMIGIPAQEKIIRNTFEEAFGKTEADNFFHTFQQSFLSDADFKLLKECGVNFIRVPFNYRLFIDDNSDNTDNKPDTLKEEGFALFDRLLDMCSQYQIFALLDLHAAPGSQNPDWHSDNSTGIPLFWEYSLFRKQTVSLWSKIAERYCNAPYLMGYDLLNEPAMANWDALNSFYNDAITEIRTADKNHIIVLEGDNFSMDFSELKHFEDDNLAIGFHYYPTVWHPELLDTGTGNTGMDRMTRKEKIGNGLDRIINQTNRFGWPVFCGEFGYAPKDCGSNELAMELLADTIDLLEERETSWLLWCYKDIGYMSLISPAKNTLWFKLADKIETSWTQNIEKEQANFILDSIKEKWFPMTSDIEKYIIQFRIRAFLYMLQGKHILLPQLHGINHSELINMAGDFSFENCVINNDIKSIVKNITAPINAIVP